MDRTTKARLLKRRSELLAERVREVLPAVRSSSTSRADRQAFDDDTVFVHAGLSDIKRTFQCNPYELLYGSLTESFESVVAPGFTPSFRSCGVYHKTFSRPEYGTFARLFFEDADHRTDDAIHSVLVDGPRRFDNCDHRHSFGEESCWAAFDRENMLCLDVGTEDFLATQLHYIEVRNDLPYVTVPEHDGVVYYDTDDYERVTQRNYAYDYDFGVNTAPNWGKMRKYLQSAGALEDHSIGGVRIYTFHARDIREALEAKLADDPYYLIT